MKVLTEKVADQLRHHHLEDFLKDISDQNFALDVAAVVAVTDSKGILTYVNDQFCEVSGYTRLELIGKTHFETVNSNYHPKEFFRFLWDTISSGRVWKGEIRNRKKTGEFYWENTTIVPFMDKENKPFQFLSIRHDVTDLKDALTKIKQQEIKLAVASKFSALGEMAANLTHEINNPLGVILGRCEMTLNLLQQERENLDIAMITKMVENIEFTARRIEKIVKSMKSFSTASDGDPFEFLKVQNIVKESIEFVQQRFKDYGIQLIQHPIDPQLTIECRGTEISQILLNLFNNAFDAIQKIEDKWVEVEVKDYKDFITISVKDCGNGVPVNVRERLFDPFFSTKEKKYGTGLGLSISKGLAEKHFGSLELDVNSTNTRFVLTLPNIQPKEKSQKS